MKWLQGIMDRFNACTEEELVGQESDINTEVNEDEKILGTLSPRLQKLSRYKGLLIDRFNAMQREHQAQHKSPDHTSEMCKQFAVAAAPLNDEIEVLNTVFWREVREELGLRADDIGLRTGWVVVELSPEQVMREQFSGMLVRIPGM